MAETVFEEPSSVDVIPAVYTGHVCGSTMPVLKGTMIAVADPGFMKI